MNLNKIYNNIQMFLRSQLSLIDHRGGIKEGSEKDFQDYDKEIKTLENEFNKKLESSELVIDRKDNCIYIFYKNQYSFGYTVDGYQMSEEKFFNDYIAIDSEIENLLNIYRDNGIVEASNFERLIRDIENINNDTFYSDNIILYDNRVFSLRYYIKDKKVILKTEFSNQVIDDEYINTLNRLRSIQQQLENVINKILK